jgi:uncharacterized protein (TIGR02466 family)
MTTSMPQLGDVFYGFSTPILMRPLPDLAQRNVELQELALAKESADKGVVKSNLGGWQSDQGLFQWEHPAIAELRRHIGEAAFEITGRACGQAVQGLTMDMHVNGWINVSRDRSYNRIHTHPDCTWSGVYYVAVGEPEPGIPDNGSIEFLDPRMAVHGGPLPGRPFGGPLRVPPEAGLMLMFPSWLMHWVHPFQGKGVRISIAFNVTLRFRPAAGTAR